MCILNVYIFYVLKDTFCHPVETKVIRTGESFRFSPLRSPFLPPRPSLSNTQLRSSIRTAHTRSFLRDLAGAAHQSGGSGGISETEDAIPPSPSSIDGEHEPGPPYHVAEGDIDARHERRVVRHKDALSPEEERTGECESLSDPPRRVGQ